MQASGPLREGDIPKWHKRTTVRTEKRRLLKFMAEDDLHNKRDNNDIRLADEARVHISAIVLIECFTPSNIKDLYSSIDAWPIRPPEYLDDIKNDIRKWRNSEGGGAWRQVATFARPGSKLFEYVADPDIPAPIRAIECMITNPLPTLTAFVAIFHIADGRSDISDKLRQFYKPRLNNVSFRGKGRLARFTHHLPFSRADKVYYNVNIVGPDLLQRQHVETIFCELEAHCWQWMSRCARGKVGILAEDRRPSLRCILLDNLEPFGPVEPKSSHQHDFSAWKSWYDSDSELPYGPPRGPLGALSLDFSPDAWTTKDRRSFYFSNEHSYNDMPLHGYFSANRQRVCEALDTEPDSSDMNIFSSIVRRFSLGLISAWTIERLLNKYKQEIAEIRDSSASSQSAYRIAEMLNEFLKRDGHDAAVVARDAARRAELDYSFREIPRFTSLMDLTYSGRAKEQAGDENKGSADDEGAEGAEEAEDAEAPKAELLVQRLKREIASSAEFVRDELDMATRSISTSATLLESMASIRLQRWSVGIAILAAVIAVIAIIVSLH